MIDLTITGLLELKSKPGHSIIYDSTIFTAFYHNEDNTEFYLRWYISLDVDTWGKCEDFLFRQISKEMYLDVTNGVVEFAHAFGWTEPGYRVFLCHDDFKSDDITFTELDGNKPLSEKIMSNCPSRHCFFP